MGNKERPTGTRPACGIEESVVSLGKAFYMRNPEPSEVAKNSKNLVTHWLFLVHSPHQVLTISNLTTKKK